MPLTIQALGEKLDHLTAGQAGYEDLLGRLAAGQEIMPPCLISTLRS